VTSTVAVFEATIWVKSMYMTKSSFKTGKKDKILYTYVYFTTKVDVTEIQHKIQEQNANYRLLDREGKK